MKSNRYQVALQFITQRENLKLFLHMNQIFVLVKNLRMSYICVMNLYCQFVFYKLGLIYFWLS